MSTQYLMKVIEIEVRLLSIIYLYKIIIDNIFAYAIATDITKSNKNPEPKSIDECQRRSDWLKWKEVMTTELNSLSKREVFGVVQTLENVKLIGYKWVFVRKQNENNEITRY